MRTIVRISMIVGLLACFVTSSAYAAGMKIAYVDLQRALLEVGEGKAAKAKLKVYFDKKQKLLDTESERLKAKKEEFDRQGMTLDPQVRAQREADLQKDFMEVQKIYYELQNELKQKESEAVAPILEKMQALLQKKAEKVGYDLVLDKNTSGIVYAPMKYDITNELIRDYDKKYKVK